MSPHQTTEELLAAIAIGADDGDAETRREAMDHIADCRDCRTFYRDLRDTAGELALSVEPVPVSDGLEQRVLEAARASGRPATAAPAAKPRRRMAAAFVAAAAAVAMLGGATIQLADQLGDERARADRIQAAATVLGDPGARRLSMNERGGDGRMTLAVGRDGAAVLIGSDLSLPDGHVFEIWLVRGTDLVPGEVFTADDGTAIVPFRLRLNRDVGIAITVERGRVEEPTTQPVYQADLTA